MTETFEHTNSQAKFPAERVTESAAKRSCEESPQVNMMRPVVPPDTLLCYHKTQATVPGRTQANVSPCSGSNPIVLFPRDTWFFKNNLKKKTNKTGMWPFTNGRFSKMFQSGLLYFWTQTLSIWNPKARRVTDWCFLGLYHDTITYYYPVYLFQVPKKLFLEIYSVFCAPLQTWWGHVAGIYWQITYQCRRWA